MHWPARLNEESWLMSVVHGSDDLVSIGPLHTIVLFFCKCASNCIATCTYQNTRCANQNGWVVHWPARLSEASRLVLVVDDSDDLVSIRQPQNIRKGVLVDISGVLVRIKYLKTITEYCQTFICYEITHSTHHNA